MRCNYDDNMTEAEEGWLKDTGLFNPYKDDSDLDGFQHISDLITTRFQKDEDRYKRLFSTFTPSYNLTEKLHTVGIDGLSTGIVTKKALIKFITKLGYKESDIKHLENNKTGRPFKEHYQNIRQFFENDPKKGRKKIETEFHMLPLTRDIDIAGNNYLLIVYNTQDLRKLCVENRKKSDYYCILSVQGLNQPTRFTHRNTYRFLNKFLKRFKLDTIDIAVDLKKRGQIKDYVNTLQQSVAEEFDTKTTVVVPTRLGANIESTVYFNTPDEASPIKGIKFYDKYTKQVEYRRDRLESVYQPWHRGEMVVKLNNNKFRESQDHIDTCLKNFLNVLQQPGILDHVEVEKENFKLFNRQLKAFKNLKHAKSLMVSPDYVLFKGTLKDTKRQEYKFYVTVDGIEAFDNRIVPEDEPAERKTKAPKGNKPKELKKPLVSKPCVVPDRAPWESDEEVKVVKPKEEFKPYTLLDRAPWEINEKPKVIAPKDMPNPYGVIELAPWEKEDEEFLIPKLKPIDLSDGYDDIFD